MRIGLTQALRDYHITN